MFAKKPCRQIIIVTVKNQFEPVGTLVLAACHVCANLSFVLYGRLKARISPSQLAAGKDVYHFGH